MGRPEYELEVSGVDGAQLYDGRLHHPHERVRIKMDVVYLRSQGLSTEKIAEICRVCKNTVRSYLDEYREGGLDRLSEIRFWGPESELEEHAEALKLYFDEHPPATLKEAAARIEEQTGLRRSATQVRKFLLRQGLQRRKVGMAPAKADPGKQEEFKKKS